MGPSFGRDLTVSTAFSNFSFDMMVDTDTRTMVKSMAMAMAICGAVRSHRGTVMVGAGRGAAGVVTFSGPPRPDTGDLTFLPPYPTILSEAHGPTFGDPPIPFT